MNDRGIVFTGAICIISLLLVMITAVNLRVNELENEVGFLREVIIELDIALEDHEYESWINNPLTTIPEDEDPFVTIN
jgi:hypothetical protein